MSKLYMLLVICFVASSCAKEVIKVEKKYYIKPFSIEFPSESKGYYDINLKGIRETISAAGKGGLPNSALTNILESLKYIEWHVLNLEEAINLNNEYAKIFSEVKEASTID